MMNVTPSGEHRRCEAEIGRPGHWHVCGRKALYVSREKRYHHGDLYYCERHKHHAESKTYVSEPHNRETFPL